ncbi:DUF1878 family protein [Oceanobacillus kapialis]|uniref:DUF1878 family protein n=1 Tax=Oceanobacillus kapialis TaxID=481353 RepID=A0ABW5Q3Q9_9BACI
MERLDQNDNAAFHLQLLSKVMDLNRFPMIKMVLEKNITQLEYKELLQLLNRLNEKYEVQQEEGLLHYNSLLVEFAGMLNEKLDPNETIYALQKEGYYPSLMATFIKIIEEDKQKYRRRKS